MKERTDLDTLYTDGGYGSPQADETLTEHEVTQVQTAIRGRTPHPDKLHLSDFEIKQTETGKPVQITCPHGQRVAVKTGSNRKGFVVAFDDAICQAGPFSQARQCLARPGKREGGRNLRAAVEATVREIKHPFPTG